MKRIFSFPDIVPKKILASKYLKMLEKEKEGKEIEEEEEEEAEESEAEEGSWQFSLIYGLVYEHSLMTYQLNSYILEPVSTCRVRIDNLCTITLQRLPSGTEHICRSFSSSAYKHNVDDCL